MSLLAQIIEDDAQSICEKVDFSEIKGRSILITGASGLLGHYFLASLKNFLKTNDGQTKVYAVAQNPPKYWREFLDYPGAKVLVGDLTDYDFCRSLPEAEYIIHAAGYGQPGLFLADPVKTLKLNTFSTFLLLEKLKTAGKFLFISTSEVYSGLVHPPHKESEIGTTNTDHKRSCYIEAKRGGEAICNAYRGRGANVKSARASLSYGPGTKPSDARALHSFINRAILEGKITLLDAGIAKRTYCYVTDAVEIMWQVLFKGQEAIYNVGGESNTTIAGLAKIIGQYVNVPVIVPTAIHPLAGAPIDVALDLTRVKNEFGKTNFISLEQGLKKTVEWQQVLQKEMKNI